MITIQEMQAQLEEAYRDRYQAEKLCNSRIKLNPHSEESRVAVLEYHRLNDLCNELEARLHNIKAEMCADEIKYGYQVY